MPISIYQASAPVFVRGLNVLAGLLDKAEAHAQAEGLDPATLVQARLAEDMYPLAGQIQRASDTSKFAIQRLSGVAAPSFPDTEATLDELRKRIADTIAYIKSVAPDKFDGAEGRSISIKLGALQPNFNGPSYLFTFALPNFYFHVATAYDVLRHAGVKIGKLDYLGPYAAN
ncbi:DUF1993 family protein [Bordetella pseudohinzii]|uniref:Uncharacterized protein conserved in bacteria n=1 Tax=Bordetella pseudohinzii TaxID=1331258 RepID=A0A0J6F0I4_9BORD|nr:DUF1993 domain-containing protein [Bordetella pseudohinzii]ANY15022.1 hypothetical protein BBN53_03400 [Bordetella pseudohinzii]KMM26055.1 hypothetical protein L540_16100 [Bordetella pseudohinzii]KXA79863.1 hypothetical protein AW878_09075 [Bordetella pseudohinzii]KXA82795.1 hypothetical protein AW877_01470 [Bordetella pseudohinzii]CUI54182.1 Uncharacterized protein conserved in bacteria [Bordetella pseudohinzii]